MKATCEHIQELLAENGHSTLQGDEAALNHVAECSDCFGVLESLRELDSAFSEVPAFDATDALVQQIVSAAKEKPKAPRRAAFTRRAYKTRFLPIPLPHIQMPRLYTGVGLTAGSAAVLVVLVFYFGADQYILVPERLQRGADIYYQPSHGSITEETPSRFDSNSSVEHSDAASELITAYNSGLEANEKDAKTNSEKGDSLNQGEVGEINIAVPSAVTKYDPRIDRLGQSSGGNNAISKSSEDLSAKRANSEAGVLAGKLDSVRIGWGAMYPTLTTPEEDLVGEKDELLEEDEDNETKDVVKSGRRNWYEASVGARIPGSFPASRIADSFNIRSANKPIQTFKGSPGAYSSYHRSPYFFQSGDEVVNRDYGWLAYDDKTMRSQPAEEAELSNVRQSGSYEAGVSLEIRKDAILHQLPSPNTSEEIAKRFLDERATLQGLTFKQASGYWANTYVPGDPLLRQLVIQLTGEKRAQLFPNGAQLEASIGQTLQPFDAPADSALRVYVNADRKGIDRESRMLVQVGLKATEQRIGRRSAMNVGLVLDLRGELSEEYKSSVRALLLAFNKARDIGDKFSLTVVGRSGGTVIKPEDFKFGAVTVALDRLFAESNDDSAVLDFSTGLLTAVETVLDDTDSDSPFGNSEAIIITGSTLGQEAHKLAQTAHESALDGINVSTVSIGSKTNPAELDRIILAGQGNRRVLSAATEAENLVNRELASASRAVARAVRLRIRLAPGAKLVDIVGSTNLNDLESQQVRKAEKQIDDRLARTLGIEADRGKDEEGIEIIIPAFYAGDSHVILLDVVASGPGPVADVTAKFKDLVFTRNGTARANLTLLSSTERNSPLEDNVLKNYLAFNLSNSLALASRALGSNNRAEAIALIEHQRLLLEGLQNQIPGLAGDNNLIRDINILTEYQNILGGSSSVSAEQRRYLSDSMRLAALLKVLPRPPLEP